MLEEQQHAFNHEAVAYLQTKGCPPSLFSQLLIHDNDSINIYMLGSLYTGDRRVFHHFVVN